MAQAFALGCEAGLLVGVGLGGVDLGELEAEHVELTLARALAGAKLAELADEGRDRVMRLAVGAAGGEVGLAGEPVEDLELGRAERQATVLVLAVEGEQAAAERPQVGGRRRPPGDECACPPRGADPAAEDDLVGPVGDPLAISASSGSSNSPSGIAKTPSIKASSAPGRTICGRALPPISRSSECASTVLPAPVSPVIAFRPAPSRSSARSISSRFSIRSSWSTPSF